MYRIKLGSGEEAVFRSAEELAIAVRTGVVSPMSEVFHNAGNRWLPIHVHPDYRAVAAGHLPGVPEDLQTPIAEAVPNDPIAVSEHQTQQPAILKQKEPESAAPLPATAELWVPSVSASSLDSEAAQAVDREYGQSTPRASRAHQLRAILALAMGLSAIGLVGGGGYAFWRYALPRLEQRHPSPRLSEGMSPAPAEPLTARRPDSFPTSYPAPAPPLPLSAGAVIPSVTAPAAARVTVAPERTLRPPPARERTPSYYEAYADARAEMDDALNYVSFQQVFEPSHFASPESIRATRRMVAAAGNIVRVYRGKEVMLEQTYRPDDPGGRGTLREPFEASEAARSLLSDVDSLFGILVSQEGRIRWTGESVSFDEPRAADLYAALRRDISTAIRTWRDSAEAQNRVTIPRLLRALNGASPPPLRR